MDDNNGTFFNDTARAASGGDNGTVLHNATVDLINDPGNLRRLIITALLCFVSVVVNVISMVAVCHIPGRLSGSHYLLINLAVTDTLGGIVSLFEIIGLILSLKHTFFYLEIYVHVMAIGYSLFVLFYLESAFTLLVFAIQRYIALCRPVQFVRMCSKERTLLAMVITWIVSFLVAIFGLLSLSFVHLGYYISNPDIWQYIWPVILVITFAVIVGLYFCVLRGLHERSSRIRSEQGVEQNYQALVTTVILITILVFTLIPYMIIKLIRYNHGMGGMATINILHWDFGIYLPYTNFISDPIIYALRMKDVREGYMCAFAGACHKSSLNLRGRESISLQTQITESDQVHTQKESLNNSKHL
ncbi:unnamed protein product [Owenia fusiformis]|uniref:Uncharacterized protein n=1 Tax=Owenia fusiformis TaxID=6347 RepID=A0A8J1TA48_OWEFU|nr:unnamed protein product [Owenia fusiformis]